MAKTCRKAVTKQFVNGQFIGKKQCILIRSRCIKDPGHDGKCRDEHGNLRDNRKH